MASARTLMGKRVLVTGASSGIGAATVRHLAREGAEVALVARDSQALEHVAELARVAGARAHAIVADVADRPSLSDAISASARAMGGLDGVVVNAAAAGFGRFEGIRAEDFDRTLAVSLTGAIDTVRLTLPHVRRSRGAIVVVGSIVASVPSPLFSSYVTAKSGLRGFVRSLRAELRQEDAGVGLSLVKPGVVSTPFWKTVTSATGRTARRPPGGYSPDPIAWTIVDCLVHPRAEVTVGGFAAALVAAYGALRPMLDPVFPLLARWLDSSPAAALNPGALRKPPAGPRPEGEGRGRPSLVVAIRRRIARGRGR